jgi:hypothetical protein
VDVGIRRSGCLRLVQKRRTAATERKGHRLSLKSPLSDFRLSNVTGPVPLETSTPHFTRITQDAFHNVLKHAAVEPPRSNTRTDKTAACHRSRPRNRLQLVPFPSSQCTMARAHSGAAFRAMLACCKQHSVSLQVGSAGIQNKESNSEAVECADHPWRCCTATMYSGHDKTDYVSNHAGPGDVPARPGC